MSTGGPVLERVVLDHLPKPSSMTLPSRAGTEALEADVPARIQPLLTDDAIGEAVWLPSSLSLLFLM